MAKSASSILLGTAGLLMSLFFGNCQDGGSELPNELHGEVVSKSNLPAANVKVGLYSVNYIPADSGASGLAWTTTTDASGNYAFKNVPSGRYNVMGLQDSLGFFRDSVSVSGPAEVGRDSLRSLGALSGTVRLQPQDEPRNAVVQVMGTDTYVNVDSSGAFTLPVLAGGVYRLRVFVALPNYVALFKDVQVRPGRHDTLPAPLVPFFSGLPVVVNIKASLDTLRGIAKITWDPVSYPAFLTYLVYRDPENAVALSDSPINLSRIEDSVYFDTLYRFDASRQQWDDTLPHNWEYRVRVEGTNTKIGEPFKPAVLHTVSPLVLATRIEIGRVDGKLEDIFPGDTVRLAAHYANAGVANRSLAWILGVSDTLRKAEIAAKAGSDTLVWIAPPDHATDSIKVEIIDVRGNPWSEVATIRPASSRIIGNIKSPSDRVDAFPCQGNIIHLSRDAQGKLVIGSFNLTTKNDSILDSTARLDTSAYAVAFWGSKLYVVNAAVASLPGANVLTFDLSTSQWGKEPNLIGGVIVDCAVAANGKLYALSPGANPWDSVKVSVLDLTTHAWTGKTSHKFNYVLGLSAFKDTVYLTSSLNGPLMTTLEKYDAGADTWTGVPLSSRFDAIVQSRLVGWKGKLYILGGSGMEANSNAVDVFDPARNSWLPAPDFRLPRTYPGAVGLGSSIYIVGGRLTDRSNTPTVEEYRPE